MSYKNLKLIKHGLILYSDLRKKTDAFVFKRFTLVCEIYAKQRIQTPYQKGFNH